METLGAKVRATRVAPAEIGTFLPLSQLADIHSFYAALSTRSSNIQPGSLSSIMSYKHVVRKSIIKPNSYYVSTSRSLASRRWYTASIATETVNTSTSTSTRQCPELRILFCGSDEFSSASLKALADARARGTLPIRSVDVACRPPKRVGTGLKKWREVPVAATARALGLPVHYVDSFRDGWELSDKTTNLVVAVSFGLLIPARVINAVQHGGLNVHPSLLPDFRGAAPIEHAMLAGCAETGVSLQTLHPSKFDHGDVLLQQTASIAECSFDEAKTKLADIGAGLLVEGLRSARFLHPAQKVEPPARYPNGEPVQRRKAPKVTPEDLRIKWQEWTAEEILRRHEVLGPLWSENGALKAGDPNSRIKWSSGFELHEDQSLIGDHQPGTMFYKHKRLHIATSDRKLLSVSACTPAGKPERRAHEAVQLIIASEPSVSLR